MKAKILIVDDDPDVLNAARIVLRQVFDTIVAETSPARLPTLLAQNDFDVVLLDMNYSAGRQSGNEGLFWLKKVLEANASTEVVLITAYGDIPLAVEAMKLGARDFIVKPWENEKLEATVRSAVAHAHSTREISKLKAKQVGYTQVANAADPPIIFKSQAMQELMHTLDRVAATDASVLLLGENGTGKDLLARHIHNNSNRKNHPLVTVDVGAFTPTLFESELFGHVKGAFTDASTNRIGRMELASGGTLFLNEIGNLPLALQPKLLTALQNRIITPVGSSEQVPIDVRVISATNTDIHNAVATGSFREDLLYRINTVTVVVPPLRERLDDIEPLAQLFLEVFSTRYKKAIDPLEPALIKLLQKQSWPGNVRQLSHAIERTVIMAEKKALSIRDFETGSTVLPPFKSESFKIEEMEKHAILQLMRKHNKNLSLVARELGIGRTTLYRKMSKYGIEK